jgi:hypothetical protein
VKLGWSAFAVGSILAAIHSILLWLTYEIAYAAAPSEHRRERCLFAVYCTAFALTDPILLQQIGSSFSDITTATAVIGGWLLLVRALMRARINFVILAGIILGIATALKPTNGLYAVSAVFLVAFLPLPIVGRLRALFYFGLAGIGSFFLIAAPWSFRLARTFGNPMFPLLNNIFKSPEAPTTAAKAYRFIPDSIIDGLARPFAMTGTANMVSEELAGPDLRYALLLIVFLISAGAWIWRSAGYPVSFSSTRISKPSTRVTTALGVAFTFAWTIWLTNSGNSRYFISMACVGTVLAVALVFRLLANNTLGRNGILAALLVAQGIALVTGTEFRWNPAPWEGRWFDIDVPPRLANAPNLYLSIGMQSNSFIVPFLSNGSGFVNFAGGYQLGPDGANAVRVRAMIAHSMPNVRVLVAGDGIYADAEHRLPRQSDVDDELRTFGLRVDMTDCATITVRGLRPSVWQRLAGSIPAPAVLPTGRLRFTSYLTTCHVVTDYEDQSTEIATRHAVDIVLDHLEDSCPALFQPRVTQTEHVNQVWLRFYGASDLTAWVTRGNVYFESAVRDTSTVSLGSQEAWSKGALPLECGRRNEIYYAKVIQPSQ